MNITPNPTTTNNGNAGVASEPTAAPTQSESKALHEANQLNQDITIIIALGCTIVALTICVIIGFCCVCYFSKKRQTDTDKEVVRMPSVSLDEVNNDNHRGAEDLSDQEIEHDDGIQMSSIASIASMPPHNALSPESTHEEKHYTKGDDEDTSSSDGNELFTDTKPTDNGANGIGTITAEGVNDNQMENIENYDEYQKESISENNNDNDAIYEQGGDLYSNVITTGGGIDIVTTNGNEEEYENSGESGGSSIMDGVTM